MNVKAAFEGRLIILPVDAIKPLRKPSEAMRETSKYRRIAQSSAEVGIIEPLVVARPAAGETQFLLLDGNTRFAILLERGEVDARCLVSSDDEAFTYNKRINRLATIQEHYMIVRALKRGVSEEKLARALNVDVKAISKRQPELLEELRGVVTAASLDQASVPPLPAIDDENPRAGWAAESPSPIRQGHAKLLETESRLEIAQSVFAA